ncbi:protein JASON [Lolium perenne]|uniref:protein JASON n=1 Tax=Lolium perenne TaxID=4522 RepID=UPI0021F682EA|nr:protein JASON-like [Lolium perenne]
MGCFLSCFRGRPASASGDGLQDPLVRASRLGDAFLDDRDDTAPKIEAGGNLKEDLGNGGGLHDELRREANYLKSCGAISETPPEILKVSNQIKADDSNECDATPNNAQDIKGIMVSEDKEYIEEFNCDGHSTLSHDKNPDEGADDVSGVEYKDNSSEGFNCDGHGELSHDQNTDEGADDVSAVESESVSLLQDKSSRQNITNQNLDSSDSPFPTPLVLRGDIQTPGTMFTAYQQNIKTGKRGRTGKQFIYPVLRPIENKLEWMELRDESSPMIASHPPKRRYLCEDSTEKPQQALPSLVSTDTELPESAPFSFHAKSKGQAEEVTSPEEHKNQNGSHQILDGGIGELLKISSSYNEKHGVASLSSWLKTSSAEDSESHSGIGGDFGKLPGFGRIGDITEVPIFVASGLNWNDDNPTPMLPKAVWDGNGIPNTTTKYKEDQKVNWHATPFEERLMKVLSDEKPKHERKISGKLIHVEEDTMESLATASS